MNILFIGDISGRPGRNALKKILPDLQKEFDVDFTITNVENASAGKGITVDNYHDLKTLNIDCFTSGNHIFAKSEIIPILEDQQEILLRPINFPPGAAGRGIWLGEVGATKLAVINLMGRVFMKELMDDPFRALDDAVGACRDRLIIVDFHAETTSEKRALGFYADGRVGAVIGTHTHVPTADAQLLPKGTAYITDVGFTGPHQSILGVDKDIIIQNFLTSIPVAHEIASGDAELGAVLLRTKGDSVESIEHIRRFVEL